MTGPFADRLFRIAFGVAGIYNLAFGLWAAVWPLAFFQLFEIEPPRYPGIWACVGMVVGVYGLLYLYAAYRLEAAWPIIAVGFLGKVLGPIGMVTSFSNAWPPRLAMLCIYNDLIWWLPFALFLIRGTWMARKLESLAPWICIATHTAAIAMLGVFLQGGTLAEADVALRANYISSNFAIWSIGWGTWMAAAAGIVGFYAWWGSRLPARNLAVACVIICALGMVCDFSGEGTAIFRLAGHGSGSLPRFLQIERQFTLLSPGIANGLYTIAGILLTLATPGLPRWIRVAMWVTWAAGVAMSIAAFANHVPDIVVSTVVLFPPLLTWMAWMSLRWRPA
jgi:hypothetical protein